MPLRHKFIVTSLLIPFCLIANPAASNHSDSTQSHNVSASDQSVRGVVNAVDRAVLSSSVTSAVKKISFRRGQNFKKGDLLVEFHCGVEYAATEAAYASYQSSLQSFQKEKELLSFDATGKFDVEIAKADKDRSLADYKARKAISDQCKVIAPFDGAVVQTMIRPHEMSQVNQPIIEIVNTEKYEVSLLIPSHMLNQLTIGEVLEFHIDETAQTEKLRLDRIGPVVDPISQTLDIIGIIDQASPTLRPGMGGKVKLNLQTGG